MRIQHTLFKGEVPKANARLLPPDAAQAALNCDFNSGSLEPLRADALVQSGSGIVDFYNHKGTFLTFTARTSVAPGPVATDRLYIMAAGAAPKMKIMPSGTEYPLAVDTPIAPPTVTIEVAATPNDPTYMLDPTTGDPVLDDDDNPVIAYDAEPLPETTVLFVYTWVTLYDEESLPSPVSYPLDVTEGSTIRVAFPDQPPVGSRINRLRVYRSVTSASGTTDYFFVQELNSATTAWVYDPATDLPQEVIPSTFYDPPISGLEGLTSMNNGMMAAFKGKDLYFCEPYKPHAWPSIYALKTEADIVGLAAFGNALAVLTTGQPHVVNGTAPENMIMDRLEINAPCVSAASIVDLGYSAAYATNDGLAVISSSGANIVSKALFSREQWRAMGPATMKAGHYDGAYVFTYTDGGTKTGIIDLGDPSQPYFIATNTVATALRHDLKSSDLYYVTASGIHEFDEHDGDPRTLTWRSKIYDLMSYVPFAVLLVEGTALGANPTDTAFSAKVYKDGALFHTITTLNTPERMPSGLGRTWEIEVTGKVRITRIAMAGSVTELMS